VTSALLEVRDLETFYGSSQALFGVSLQVAEGQFVTLLGRNGMGKTTTVKTIMGMLPARRGAVRFRGRELQGSPSYRVAQAGIGLVPEGRQIFPDLTVRENLVATASTRHAKGAPWTLDSVYRMFPALHERSRNLGASLSGGEQQMLAIARALMTNPRLLILDEATEGLAPRVRAEIWRCLAGLKQTGLAIIAIDKNIGPLLRLADRHFIIEKGRVVWSGDSSALRGEKRLLSEYLGL
jgi:branched-chain amino acid transport system ATP-binding protein